MVKLVPIKPLCVDRLVDNPALGRFSVRDLRRTVAVGLIKDMEKRALLLSKATKIAPSPTTANDTL
jgi:elongation factor 1-alpha